MQKKIRDEVALAFTDSRQTGNPLLLIHGWGCDHSTLACQEEFFSQTHRVINVDLRGHGQSGCPDTDYEVGQFADDLYWLCGQLGIQHAMIVGHSMGGAIAIETAYRYPELVRGVAMIDTVFRPSSTLVEFLAPLLPALQGDAYEEAYRTIMLSISRPSEAAALAAVLSPLPAASQRVLLSALHGHMETHDFATAAAACSVPAAYIAASGTFADLGELKRLIPHLFQGQTLGAGHFAPLLVPAQVNAMLATFVELVSESEVVRESNTSTAAGLTSEEAYDAS